MRWLVFPLLVLVSAGLAYGLWPRGTAPADGGFDVAGLIAALGDDWADAATGGSLPDAPLVFPADYGAHSDAPAEVWDLSAILTARDVRIAAVRLTLARLALAAPSSNVVSAAAPQVRDPSRVGAASDNGDATAALHEVTTAATRSSAFAADALFAGQLLLDTSGGDAGLRATGVSRGALGLAGAESDAAGRERVWLEHWELVRDGKQLVRVEASADAVALSLALVPTKVPVPFDATLGAASDSDGFALNGYSEPRLQVSGTLEVAGQAREVSGAAWLEHGWGSLAAALSGGSGQLVASRFRLQLNDGVDLTCLHLRRRGGGGTPIPSCALIGPDGDSVAFGRRDLSLTPSDDRWVSALGGRYPLRWHLAIPRRGLELEIAPLLDEPSQSLRALAFDRAGPTWSGAVEVTGTRGSDTISGVGFMDLTGYGGAVAGT